MRYELVSREKRLNESLQFNVKGDEKELVSRKEI